MGIKGGWHVPTMLGGLTVGVWWGMKRGGMITNIDTNSRGIGIILARLSLASWYMED